jgi:hypothetical protein
MNGPLQTIGKSAEEIIARLSHYPLGTDVASAKQQIDRLSQIISLASEIQRQSAKLVDGVALKFAQPPKRNSN